MIVDTPLPTLMTARGISHKLEFRVGCGGPGLPTRMSRLTSLVVQLARAIATSYRVEPDELLVIDSGVMAVLPPQYDSIQHSPVSIFMTMPVESPKGLISLAWLRTTPDTLVRRCIARQPSSVTDWPSNGKPVMGIAIVRSSQAGSGGYGTCGAL